MANYAVVRFMIISSIFYTLQNIATNTPARVALLQASKAETKVKKKRF
jgi:hypothetical protein